MCYIIINYHLIIKENRIFDIYLSNFEIRLISHTFTITDVLYIYVLLTFLIFIKYTNTLNIQTNRS